MNEPKVKVCVGELFASQAQTFVNTVNCVGVMGAGIARAFKKRFPAMHKDYLERCKKNEVKLGKPYPYTNLPRQQIGLPSFHSQPWPSIILNFPTKDHWRSVSRLNDIVRGLEYLEKHYEQWGITSLAVPPLGCGQGQLEWRIVGPTLYRHLNRLKIAVELYAPYETPANELEERFLDQPVTGKSVDCLTVEPSKINPGWVALVAILAKIEDEPFHWPVGRTMFQKIAFFATAKGIPTGLRYKRNSYGPFSVELKSLTTRLLNHGLIQEERLGQMFSVKPGPTYQDAAESYQAQLRQWEEPIEQITDLFVRIHTKQAEMAATVYFAAHELIKDGNSKPTELDVFNAVQTWKQKRRPPLQEEDIAVTIRNLNLLRWLDLAPSRQLPLPATAMGDV